MHIYQLYIQKKLTREPEAATPDEISHQQTIEHTHTNAPPTTTPEERIFQTTAT